MFVKNTRKILLTLLSCCLILSLINIKFVNAASDGLYIQYGDKDNPSVTYYTYTGQTIVEPYSGNAIDGIRVEYYDGLYQMVVYEDTTLEGDVQIYTDCDFDLLLNADLTINCIIKPTTKFESATIRSSNLLVIYGNHNLNINYTIDLEDCQEGYDYEGYCIYAKGIRVGTGDPNYASTLNIKDVSDNDVLDDFDGFVDVYPMCTPKDGGDFIVERGYINIDAPTRGIYSGGSFNVRMYSEVNITRKKSPYLTYCGIEAEKCQPFLIAQSSLNIIDDTDYTEEEQDVYGIKYGSIMGDIRFGDSNIKIRLENSKGHAIASESALNDTFYIRFEGCQNIDIRGDIYLDNGNIEINSLNVNLEAEGSIFNSHTNKSSESYTNVCVRGLDSSFLIHTDKDDVPIFGNVDNIEFYDFNEELFIGSLNHKGNDNTIFDGDDVEDYSFIALKEPCIIYVNGKEIETYTYTTLDVEIDDPEPSGEDIGKIFVGWFYKDEDGNEVEFSNDYFVPGQDIELYPKWVEPGELVSYDLKAPDGSNPGHLPYYYDVSFKIYYEDPDRKIIIKDIDEWLKKDGYIAALDKEHLKKNVLKEDNINVVVPVTNNTYTFNSEIALEDIICIIVDGEAVEYSLSKDNKSFSFNDDLYNKYTSKGTHKVYVVFKDYHLSTMFTIEIKSNNNGQGTYVIPKTGIR